MTASAKRNRIREGSRAGNLLLGVVAVLLCLITLYPMYYVLILSVSDPLEAATMNVYFYPKGFFLDSYAMLVKDTDMWRAYANTFLYVITRTLLTILTCVLCAYPLTSPRLIGRKFVNIFLLITMYFGGGLIPSFMVRTRLGLYNNPWALIIPGCFSVWYIILTKTYFQSVPETMREAARIDGANHVQTMFRIYLPIAKPIIAVVAIYTVVTVWNDWFEAQIYLPTVDWQPLQLYLRRVLVENSVSITSGLTQADMELAARMRLSNIQLKYAMIIFTTLPVIFAYPFFQKYFVKGVMLGSLKE